MSAGSRRITDDSSRERRLLLALAALCALAGLAAIANWTRAQARHALARRRMVSLSERSDLLRALLTDAPAALALFDESRRCVAASAAFTALFRVAPVGKRPQGAPPPACDALFAMPRERGVSDWIEIDGAPRWVWRETRTWRDASGAPVGLIAAAADLTEQRALEDACRAATAQAEEMGAVLEEAGQEIYIVDVETLRLLHVNRGARENLGFTRDELMTMTPEDIRAPGETSRIQAAIERLRGGGADLVRYEVVHRRKDGSTYPCEVVLSLRGRAGARRYVAIADDITERRAVEAERARVTERLRLSENDLREALKEADAASRLKSEFLAHISHEIRTPLNGILGGVALIRASDDPETRSRWLDIVEASARALHQVIDDVLEIAQIEAGTEPLETVAFDPVALVAEAVERLRAQADAKGLAMLFGAIEGAPAAWRGDPARIARIIDCLLDNAVKFTERGMVSVRVGGDGALLRVEVADTGPGVAEADRESIFERFRQLDGSATRRHGGVGLGLAIAREFSHMMGGRIGVRSAPGHGAIFWLEFDAGDRSPVAARARGGAVA
jgi:PAS domain S-box-containing protein